MLHPEVISCYVCFRCTNLNDRTMGFLPLIMQPANIHVIPYDYHVSKNITQDYLRFISIALGLGRRFIGQNICCTILRTSVPIPSTHMKIPDSMEHTLC